MKEFILKTVKKFVLIVCLLFVSCGNYKMVDKKQMKHIINDVLQKMGEKYSSPEALELIYNTGLVESKYVYKAVLEDNHRHAAINELLELLNGYN